jgi:hypothetical protein
MPSTSNLLPALRAPFVPAWPVQSPWIDAYARWVEGWFDWQCAVWQPLIDAQAEYLRQSQEQFGVPALALLAPLRGAEQLA